MTKSKFYCVLDRGVAIVVNTKFGGSLEKGRERERERERDGAKNRFG